MSSREIVRRRAATIAAVASAVCLAAAPASAGAAAGFGPLSGPTGCLAAPESRSSESGTDGCGEGKGLVGANAVAVSPDGANVYVAAGTAGNTVASSFGAVVILKRDPTTGGITETGCLSSDGTDGRDGASGACTTTPSLLGADGVAVSPDGSTVFVTSKSSASVVAFARDPATGSLTRLGCFQGTPRPGSPCPPAKLFPSSSALVTSADNMALYIAAPLEGAISTFTADTLPPTSNASGSSSSQSSNPSPSGSGSSVASIFGAPATTPFFANPCIAVNGSDGSCSVGTAMQGLDALALSPDGKQLYGAAPGSDAVDVFTHDATGLLTENSCLKVSAPPGLCSSSKLMNSPTRLAISLDGKNVYATDSSGGGDRVDVLARDPTSGALSDASCVDFLAEEKHEEGNEEEQHEPPPPPGPCEGVAGLDSVKVVAVSGDGSAVYTLGSGAAAIFSRDPSTGKLTETSCAVNEDNRCSSIPSLQDVEGAAVSPDGREVYVAAAGSNAVMVFGIGAAVTTAQAAATHAGIARVRVECPAGLRRSCSGRVELTRVLAGRARHGRRRVRVRRIGAGDSARFTISPGDRATILVRLSRSARRLLVAKRRLRLMAVVRADQFAGGSGYGRGVMLSLVRHQG
jgi:DNA-binding beta-propeller fold protein YncE